MAYQHYFGLFRTKAAHPGVPEQRRVSGTPVDSCDIHASTHFCGLPRATMHKRSTQLTVMEYAPSSAVIP